MKKDYEDIKKRNRVALVGLSCHYSGVENLKDFWRILKNGECTAKPMQYRFPDYDKYYNPDKAAKGKFYNQEAFFLSSDIYQFDADFFGISYQEAKHMDIQQRLLLHTCYEAVEDAGLLIKGSHTGVYIGAFMQDYLTHTMQRQNYYNLDGYDATGSSIGMLANRLSYYFNLHGPSLTIDTACSSSLTALHLATESIVFGQCDIAICGAVNVINDLGNFITLCKGSFLSQRSRCSAFSENADGYARGEGVGVLVLKDYDTAVRDKDNIYCEIIATGINHDGHTTSLTYPGLEAQIDLLKSIYHQNHVSVEDISYIETHGTGTQAGDQTELKALDTVFGKKSDPLLVGSVKTNIGHTEAAAGLASVIKSVMILEHGEIPKTLHAEIPNPSIPFHRYNVALTKDSKKIEPAKDGRYYIGINGFGFGGSNAHVVIASVTEESEKQPEICFNQPFHVLHITAKSKTSLYAKARDYMWQIQSGTLKQYTLNEICLCVNQRRSQEYPHRLAIIAESKQDLAKKLIDFQNDELNEGIFFKHQNKSFHNTVALFSGMGNQSEHMGKTLYRTFLVFRDTFDLCSKTFEYYSKVSLSDVIQSKEVLSNFFEVDFLQPYLLAYQISLFKLIQSFGITFGGFVGHSAGELAAFYLSGFLSLKEIFRISYYRGKYQNKLTGKGKMLVVGITLDKAKKLCLPYENKVSIAVINGEENIVLAGDEDSLKIIESTLDETIFRRFVNGSIAYHSAQMDEIKDEFIADIMQGEPATDVAPLYSTVYADRLKAENYSPDYWWKNIRNTVEFYKTIKKLKQEGYDSFIEIGPTPVLPYYISEAYANTPFSYISFQKKKECEVTEFYRGLARAFVHQIDMDFKTQGSSRMLKLPKYKWDKKSFINPVISNIYEGTKSTTTILGYKLNLPVPIWEVTLNLNANSWLHGHCVEKEHYLPGTFYAAMIAETGAKRISDIQILSPVILSKAEDTVLSLTKHSNGYIEIAVTDQSRKHWKNCCSAHMIEEEFISDITKRYESRYMNNQLRWNNKWEEDVDSILEKTEIYDILRVKSLYYEDAFCLLNKACIGENDTLAELFMEPGMLKDNNLVTILDAMLQTIALAGNREPIVDKQYLFLPSSIEEAYIQKIDFKQLYVYAEMIENTNQSMIANAYLYNESYNLIICLNRVVFRSKQRISIEEEIHSYYTTWENIVNQTEHFGWKDIVNETDHFHWKGIVNETKKADHTERIHSDGCAGVIVFYATENAEKDCINLIELVRHFDTKVKKLIVVTCNAYKVLETDIVAGYEQGALWGLCRCIRLEHQQFSLYLMDTDDLSNSDDYYKQLTCIEGEFEIAIRKNQIFGIRIKPKEVRLDAFHSVKNTAVITGASGGLAFSYALYLLQSGIQHIALITRRESKQTQKLQCILNYYGANVRLFTIDITDETQLRACFLEIDNDFPKGKAIYHLAGYNEDCLSQGITTQLLKQHFQPKREGAKLLSSIMDTSCDELFLFGSIVGLAGNVGQAAYSAANTFIHSFSEYFGCHMIGFGALNTGMTVNNQNAQTSFSLQSIKIMDTKSAIAVAEASKLRINYIAMMDWEKLLEQRNAIEDKKYFYLKEKRQKENHLLHQLKTSDYVQQKKIIRDFLVTIYSDALAVEKEMLDMERSTDTLGVYSLSSTLIANQINRNLNTNYTSLMVTGQFSIEDLATELHLWFTEKNI